MEWIALVVGIVAVYFFWKRRKDIPAMMRDGEPSQEEVPGWREALDAKYERLETSDEEGQDARNEDYRDQWRDRLEEHLGKCEAKRLEPCYRKIFGGDIQCLFNFTMFMSRVGHAQTVLIVPPGDHYRPRFEALAATGAVLRGDAVQPIDRLGCLGMDQLRTLADACGAKRAQSKDELRRRINAQGAEAIAAAWPALGIPESDIFLLDPARIRELCA